MPNTTTSFTPSASISSVSIPSVPVSLTSSLASPALHSLALGSPAHLNSPQQVIEALTKGLRAARLPPLSPGDIAAVNILIEQYRLRDRTRELGSFADMLLETCVALQKSPGVILSGDLRATELELKSQGVLVAPIDLIRVVRLGKLSDMLSRSLPQLFSPALSRTEAVPSIDELVPLLTTFVASGTTPQLLNVRQNMVEEHLFDIVHLSARPLRKELISLLFDDLSEHLKANPITHYAVWESGAFRRSIRRLVKACEGSKGFDPETLRALWVKLLKEPGIDLPALVVAHQHPLLPQSSWSQRATLKQDSRIEVVQHSVLRIWDGRPVAQLRFTSGTHKLRFAEGLVGKDPTIFLDEIDIPCGHQHHLKRAALRTLFNSFVEHSVVKRIVLGPQPLELCRTYHLAKPGFDVGFFIEFGGRTGRFPILGVDLPLVLE